MRTTIQRRSVSARMLAVGLVAAAASACSDGQPVASGEPLAVPVHRGLQEFTCTGSTVGATINCAPAALYTGGASAALIGGQGTYVQLTSSNVSFDSVTSIFQFDVTVTNLMNEAIGTPDGTTADPEGIQLFFHTGPTITSGTGTVEVINSDGFATFTAANQPYFEYFEILGKNQTSSPKTWQIEISGNPTFSFTIFVETDVQYLLVINEVLVNPGGTILDANGEWVEIYNGGTRSVDLQGLVIADSSAGGRRPYHLIGSSLVVPAGGYVVLGNTTNTTNNGGVTVDYAYGAALQLANSVDAVKISRPYGTDTLTIDRTQYSTPATSAQNGISRELKNPSLDNSSMDGSNWADALTTAVYGTGGRGTPKAQNSTYTP